MKKIKRFKKKRMSVFDMLIQIILLYKICIALQYCQYRQYNTVIP